MRTILVGAVTLLLALTCLTGHGQDKKNDPVAKELAKWQGKWTGQSGGAQGWTLVIAGDKLESYQETLKLKHNGVLKIDPTKTPKTWDYTITEGPEKGLLTLGIYELKGDELTLCYVEGGDKARPTEFAVGGKGGEYLQVWKREKR